MKWEVNLAPELDAFIQEQLRTGNWGTSDVLFNFALAIARQQLERSKNDGTAQMLSTLVTKFQAEGAKQTPAPVEDMLGGMMGAVPIAATPAPAAATATPGGPVPPAVADFLKQLQALVTNAQQKKPS